MFYTVSQPDRKGLPASLPDTHFAGATVASLLAGVPPLATRSSVPRIGSSPHLFCLRSSYFPAGLAL